MATHPPSPAHDRATAMELLQPYGYLVNFVRPIRRFSDGASPSSPLRRNWGAPPPTLAPRHPPRPPRPPNRRPAAAWPSTTSETYPETSAFNLVDRSVFQAFSLAARPVDYSHERRPPSPRPAPYVVSDPRAAISPRLGPHEALLGRWRGRNRPVLARKRAFFSQKGPPATPPTAVRGVAGGVLAAVGSPPAVLGRAVAAGAAPVPKIGSGGRASLDQSDPQSGPV